MSKGMFEQAEREFRAALSYAPDNGQLKLGLANAFFKQGKRSAALVVLEDLLSKENASPKAYLLYARLLLKSGEKSAAIEHYQRALHLDATLGDPTLAEQLGLNPILGEDEEESEDELMPLPSELPEAAVEIGSERPDISFADVGGLAALKEEIRMKIVYPLMHPELYEAYGKAPGGELLFFGPPGCGKSLLARATAGEINAEFLPIGIHDVLEAWVGNSERNLHEIFEYARERKPCVLFFDEFDAFAGRRHDLRRSGARQLVNQFLAELDGYDANNHGLLVLAATNAPWDIDPACLRPGRFDRLLFVPPPDLQARAEILQILLRGKPVDDVDYEYLARKTEGFSGADLKGAVDAAIETRIRLALQRQTIVPLTTRDILRFVQQQNPGVNEWFMAARRHARIRRQTPLYQQILRYLKQK